jgi:hypothetical protein
VIEQRPRDRADGRSQFGLRCQTQPDLLGHLADVLADGDDIVLVLYLDLVGLEGGAIDYIPKDSFAERNLLEALRQLGIL